MAYLRQRIPFYTFSALFPNNQCQPLQNGLNWKRLFKPLWTYKLVEMQKPIKHLHTHWDSLTIPAFQELSICYITHKDLKSRWQTEKIANRKWPNERAHKNSVQNNYPERTLELISIRLNYSCPQMCNYFFI